MPNAPAYFGKETDDNPQKILQGRSLDEQSAL